MARRQRKPGVWEVRVYAGQDPATGKQRYVSRSVHGSERAAKKLEAELIRELDVEAGQATGMTFGELAAVWQERNGHEPSTRYQTRSMLRNRILPRWGDTPVDKITAGALTNWFVELVDSGLAVTTVKRHAGVMSACFGWAMRGGRGWVTTNPCLLAEMPKARKKELTIPDPEVVAACLADLRASDDPSVIDLWVFVRIAAVTGMRRGELCALRASDIDLDWWVLRKSRAIGLGYIAREHTNGGTIAEGVGQRAYEKSTKTGDASAIALDRHTIAIIRWHLWRLRVTTRQLGIDLDADPYLFSWAPDRSVPWRPDNPTHRLRKLTDGKLQLLTLRHFVASNMLAAGIDLKTVSGRLGHKRTSTTADIYAKWIPPADRKAADLQGRILGR